MEITMELLRKLRAAKSKEAFEGILAENKIELTAEDVEGWYRHESKIAEMPDDELAQVTGGMSVPTGRRNQIDPMSLACCDRREDRTCSVPYNVCSGMPVSAWGVYARTCRQYINDNKRRLPGF